MAQHSSKDSWTAKLTATGIKLNDTNYLDWANAFETFLAAHMREHHIIDDPPDSTTPLGMRRTMLLSHG